MGIIIELQKTQHKLDLVLVKLTEIAPKLDSLLGTPDSQGAVDYLSSILDTDIASGSLVAAGLTLTNSKIDKLQATLDDANKSQPSQPGEFSFKIVSQVQKGDQTMLKFDVVGIPPVDMTDPNNKDVAKRVLTVTVASGTPIVTEITDLAQATVSNDGFVGNAGDALSASLVDVDGSGNESLPRTETATLTDSISPDQPGDFGFLISGQV